MPVPCSTTVVLAKLRDPRVKASEEIIRKSLVGNWQPEHLFTLKQSRQSYQHYREQIAACDEQIEKLLVAASKLYRSARGTCVLAAAVSEPARTSAW